MIMKRAAIDLLEMSAREMWQADQMWDGNPNLARDFAKRAWTLALGALAASVAREADERTTHDLEGVYRQGKLEKGRCRRCGESAAEKGAPCPGQ